VQVLDQALLLARVAARLLRAWVAAQPVQARVAVPQLMPPTVALRPPVLPLLVQALLVPELLVQALLVQALLVQALLVRAKAILLPPQLPVRGQLLTPEPAPK
jgi:hypothetical protein